MPNRKRKVVASKADADAEDGRTSIKINDDTHQMLMLLRSLYGKGWTIDRVIQELIERSPDAPKIRAMLGK